MALSDFLNGYTSVSFYSRVTQKTMFCQKKKKKKNSHISYVAHQNYVSHKKIANCANKKLCDFQKETHVD